MEVIVLTAALAAASAPPPLAVPDEAMASGALERGEPRVETRLVLDAAAVTPGDSFRVGVLFSMDPSWHVYWKNPGESAKPTEVRFEGEGLTVGELQWPAPHVFRTGDGFITTYGYEGEVLLFAKAQVGEGAKGEIEIEAAVDYLACSTICVPGRAKLKRRLPVRDASAQAPDVVQARFDQWARQVPRSPSELGVTVTAVIDHAALPPRTSFRGALALIACSGPPADGAHCPTYRAPGGAFADAFVPERINGVDLEVTAARPHPAAFAGVVLDLQGKTNSVDPGADQRLRGVVKLAREDGAAVFVNVDEPLPRARPTDAVARTTHPLLAAAAVSERDAAGPRLPLWRALILALLGGLILNLMPCVLPVLAIKVASFTRAAHGDPRTIALHGIAYTVGVLGAMSALALLVIVLERAGHAVGWGFQFQEPRFVAVVAAILVVLALNLFGLFEIHVGAGGLDRAMSRSHGLVKVALEGVLAVVVATPCSAPFLGTAVGFALASSPLTIALVFWAIGLGLAAPFLVLTLWKGARRIVPKPGAWMEQLRRALGFALLGAALWLVSLAGGAEEMTALLAFLLSVSFAVWVAGVTRRRALGLVMGAIIVAVAGGTWLRFDEASAAEVTRWRDYDEQAIAGEVARGKMVFVDFTADWCITCKVNERGVLASERVREALEAHEVVLFKADWTRRDETIRAALQRFGKAGVPMYLLYGRSSETPEVLPELLTEDLVLDALARAAGRT